METYPSKYYLAQQTQQPIQPATEGGMIPPGLQERTNNLSAIGRQTQLYNKCSNNPPPKFHEQMVSLKTI